MDLAMGRLVFWLASPLYACKRFSRNGHGSLQLHLLTLVKTDWILDLLAATPVESQCPMHARQLKNLQVPYARLGLSKKYSALALQGFLAEPAEPR